MYVAAIKTIFCGFRVWLWTTVYFVCAIQKQIAQKNDGHSVQNTLTREVTRQGPSIQVVPFVRGYRRLELRVLQGRGHDSLYKPEALMYLEFEIYSW